MIAKACKAILEAPNRLQAITLNRETFSLGALVGQPPKVHQSGPRSR
jgi:hypothetical protein